MYTCVSACARPPCPHACKYRRLISLTSWTLQLCEGAAPVTASSGDTQASASSASASAEVSTGSSSSSPAPAGGDNKATARIGQGKVAEQAKGMLGLLFPGLKEEDMGEYCQYVVRAT